MIIVITNVSVEIDRSAFISVFTPPVSTSSHLYLHTNSINHPTLCHHHHGPHHHHHRGRHHCTTKILFDINRIKRQGSVGSVLRDVDRQCWIFKRIEVVQTLIQFSSRNEKASLKIWYDSLSLTWGRQYILVIKHIIRIFSLLKGRPVFQEFV